MPDFTPLPPEEAIRFFRRKGYRTGFNWRDTWHDEHARSFTVAKAMSMDVLDAIRKEVDRAIARGATLEDFRKRLTPALQRLGWWGRQAMTDPLTGERVNAQLGSPRRLKIIFDTNIRSAYAAGQWDRIQRNKRTRPWLKYSAVDDERTRRDHRGWHDTVLPVDDSWWHTHYPPNGWNCRCSVIQLSSRDLERDGLRPSGRPPLRSRQYQNTRTGEITELPEGIDPGFAFNAGRAGRRHAAAEQFARSAARIDPDIAAAGFAVDRPALVEALQRQYGDWRTARPGPGVPDRVPVTVLDRRTIAALREAGEAPQTAVVYLKRQRASHVQRPGKQARGQAITPETFRDLPTLMAAPRAVVYDTRTKALIYLLDAGPGVVSAVVVAVGVRAKRQGDTGRRRPVAINHILTAGDIQASEFGRDRYRLIWGEL